MGLALELARRAGGDLKMGFQGQADGAKALRPAPGGACQGEIPGRGFNRREPGQNPLGRAGMEAISAGIKFYPFVLLFAKSPFRLML